MKAVQVLAVMAAIASSMAASPGGRATAGPYPQIGGGPGHLGVASGGGPTQLSSPRFSVAGFSWVSQAGVAVGLGKVIGLATSLNTQGQASTAVVAVNERTGQHAWTAYVPAPFVGSWSWPAIDEKNRIVLVAERNRLTALDIASGGEKWFLEAGEGKMFVNASPTVAGGVVYIVDYINKDDGTSRSTLYAADGATGEVLWSIPVGRTSGANTVAVSGNKVMVANFEGRFLMFDRVTGAAFPELPLSANGFFCGVAAEGSFAYVVSYAFSSLNGPTKLYKIDTSGSVPTKVWEAVAPRTDTIPVITTDLVLVSGGDGYPKFPSLEPDIDWPSLFAFDKVTGEFRWRTEAAGGWTSQPVYADGIVYLPTQTGPFTGPTSKLVVLDVRKTPAELGFLVTETGVIANSVVVANGNVYGTGPAGLQAFGPAVRIPGDINNDGKVNVFDLQRMSLSWNKQVGEVGYDPVCDLNSDGRVNVFDLQILAANWNKW